MKDMQPLTEIIQDFLQNIKQYDVNRGFMNDIKLKAKLLLN